MDRAQLGAYVIARVRAGARAAVTRASPLIIIAESQSLR